MRVVSRIIVVWSATVFAALAAAQAPAAADDAEGLVAVPSRYFDTVLVRPGVDPLGSKAILETTQVALKAGWLKDMNRYNVALMQRTTQQDADRVVAEVAKGFDATLASTFARKGVEVIATPGPGVVKLSPRIVDLYVNAPRSVTTALPGRTYTTSAGDATLVLDIRDSISGRLLARVVDYATVGDRGDLQGSLRNTNPATNAFDFEGTFQEWAQEAAEIVAGKAAVARTP